MPSRCSRLSHPKVVDNHTKSVSVHVVGDHFCAYGAASVAGRKAVLSANSRDQLKMITRGSRDQRVISNTPERTP